MSSPTYTRRQWFVTWMQRSAAVATGGLLWTYLLQQQTRAAPIVMRPPGALPEPDFQAACVKCGQCVQACPLQQAAIRVLPPALVQGEMGAHYRLGWTVDTPITQQFQPQEVPDTPPSQAPAASALDYLNQGGAW